MTDSETNDVHDHPGTTTLEEALVRVEQGLDKTFEAAERRAQVDDEPGAGLILEQVLDLIYETFAPAIPYDRIGVAVVEEDGSMVRSRWARSEEDSVSMGVGYAAPLEDETVQMILSSGEPLIVNDLERYLDENPGSDPAQVMVEEGMRSSFAYPLSEGDRPIGLIVFSSSKPDAYTEVHQEMFAHVATHVAAILERSRLYERLIDLNWQLRVARDALEYQATHDGLTRLWNRSAIMDVAENELDRARRHGEPITIVMADVDSFKNINDTYGHQVGDVVLQTVSDRLSGALRSYETVGRYGGEEFLITLFGCDTEGAGPAMERMRNAVGEHPVDTQKGDLEVTISLGGAVSTDPEASLDVLVRAADEALYEAKSDGGDRYVVASVEKAE